MPREDNLVAGRAAAAKKMKNKTPSAKTRKGYERAAAAAEKKAVAAEAEEERAKEGALGADAIAATAQAAFWARARATSARDRLAAAAPSERHAASCRLGNAAQINGSVKHVKPSLHDQEAHREAEQRLTVEQVALRKMREQRHGWVCALWVKEQLPVLRRWPSC